MRTDTLDIVKPEHTPNDFRPNHKAHKSNWAIVLIIIALILGGIFFYVREQILLSRSTTASPVTTVTPTPTLLVDTSSLEKSIESITIPDYSDLF